MSIAESKIHPVLQDEKSFIHHQSNFLDSITYNTNLDSIIKGLESYHQDEPLGKGLPREELILENKEIGEFILARALADGLVRNQGNLWQLAGHQSELDDADEKIRSRIKALFTASEYSSPALSVIKAEIGESADSIVQWMIQHGDLVRIDKDYYILDVQFEHFITVLKDWFRENEELSVGQLREIIPTSRKYLLPLLNFAERKGMLLRVGDVRTWAGEELD